jgi:hypothetical protein
MARCEKTGKVIHATEEAARAAIASLYRADRGNPHYNAYRCPFGGAHWHVGHSAYSLNRAIKNALRSGRAATAAGRRRRKR